MNAYYADDANESRNEPCYSQKRGRRCLLCEHTACESCPDCSPEVPD